jgi:hypothetical protein
MAQPGEALDRYDLATNGDTVREDLSDIIHNISPTETPFQSNIGRGSASSDKPEWQIDSLATANEDNAHIDGDDFSGDALTDPTRLATYCQISRKDIVVTRRADKVNKAGMKSALAYFVAKAGKELKRDVEARITNNQIPVQGNATLASETGGADVWLTSNTSNGALGSDPTLSGGLPNAAATPGNEQQLSEADLLTVIRSCYENGGNPTMIMMIPEVKQAFSNFMFSSSASLATQNQDHGTKPRGGLTVVGAVDVYVSNFGVLDVVPNRFQTKYAALDANSSVFVIDPEYWEVAYLDGYMTERIAKSGDSEKRMLLVDYGLCCKNEAASGVVRAINNDAAMAS